MFARLALNVNATMMPYYLVTVTAYEPLDGLETSPVIAAVPLITYICSLIFTVFIQKPLTQRFRNRLIPMLVSVVVTTMGSVPLLFLSPDPNTRWLVYPCAAFIGVGIALMLNTGTSLISDVIGNDVKSAAFIYGVYSLLDKFANGFLLYFLVANYNEDANALPWIIGMIPILSSVGTAIVTWIGLKLYSDKLAKISSGSMLKPKNNLSPEQKERVKEQKPLLD
jgi:Na+/melibiose symporter-like transporter